MDDLLHRTVIATDRPEALTEYLLSKQQKHQIKHYPQWDVLKISSAFELIKARQELNAVEHEVQEKNEEKKLRRQSMDALSEDMKAQKSKLCQSFIEFDEFIKENQEKRERAENKIKDEHKRQENRLKEIDELTEKLNRLRTAFGKMQNQVKEHEKYQNYLEKVIEETKEFESISDIFNRYETLVEVRKASFEQQEQNFQIFKDTGTRINHMTDKNNQALMELNNKLAQLQRKHETSQTLVLKWENAVSKIKEVAAIKNLELTQVKSCCWNIYEQVCKRKGIPIKANSDDVERQLVHIKRTISELKLIIKVAKKMAAGEKLCIDNIQ